MFTPFRNSRLANIACHAAYINCSRAWSMSHLLQKAFLASLQFRFRDIISTAKLPLKVFYCFLCFLVTIGSGFEFENLQYVYSKAKGWKVFYAVIK